MTEQELADLTERHPYMSGDDLGYWVERLLADRAALVSRLEACKRFHTNEHKDRLAAEASLVAAQAERDAYLKRVDEAVVRAQRNEVRAITAEDALVAAQEALRQIDMVLTCADAYLVGHNRGDDEVPRGEAPKLAARTIARGALLAVPAEPTHDPDVATCHACGASEHETNATGWMDGALVLCAGCIERLGCTLDDEGRKLVRAVPAEPPAEAEPGEAT